MQAMASVMPLYAVAPFLPASLSGYCSLGLLVFVTGACVIVYGAWNILEM